jgi:hypothetical protein
MSKEYEFRVMVKCPFKEGSDKLYTYYVHESLENLAVVGAKAMVVKPDGSLIALDIVVVEDLIPQPFTCKPVLTIYSKEAYAEWVETCKNI